MSKGNGGPSFARPKSPKGEYTDSEVPCAQTGMSLRDYFAAKAMQAMISTVGAQCLFGVEGCEPNTADGAYKMADAMLAERAK